MYGVNDHRSELNHGYDSIDQRICGKIRRSKSDPHLFRKTQADQLLSSPGVHDAVFAVNVEKFLQTRRVLPVPLITKRKEELDKITQIQAAIRGWNARNQVTLFHQIYPAIHAHLLGYYPTKYKDITRLLCLELNKLSLDPKKYAGKSVRLAPTPSAYVFKKPGKKPKRLCRPFSLWLEMEANGYGFRVLIIPEKKYSPLGELLGSGSNRDVYRAQSLSISRTLADGHRSIAYEPCIMAKIKDSCVEDGLKIQEEILRSVNGKFAEMSFKPLPRVSGMPHYSEIKQIWYNIDFNKAIKLRSVPLDFTINPASLPLQFKDILNIFVDVVNSLVDLHEKGYVHRDLKNSNVFLKVIERKIEGYIGDFDFAQKIGTSDTMESYPYWDVFSRCGLVFPSTDNFALVISLAEALVPGFYQHGFHIDQQLLLKDDNFVKFKAYAITSHITEKLNALTIHPVWQVLMSAVHQYNISLTQSQHYIGLQVHFTKIIADFIHQNASDLYESDINRLRDLIHEIRVIAKILDKVREVYNRDQMTQIILDKHPDMNNYYVESTVKDAQAFYKSTIVKFTERTRDLKNFIELLCNELARSPNAN